jgi:hypothetical protein
MAIPGTAPQTQPQTRDALSAVQSADASGVVADQSAIMVDRRSYPFILRHHVSNWELAAEGLEEPTLLPEIVPHVMMQGAAGVRTINRNETLQDGWRKAVSDARDQDWHYVPGNIKVTDPAHLPSGVSPGGWIRSCEAKHIKSAELLTWYHTPWEVPIATPRGSVQRWRFDRAAFNRWRLSLVGTVIPLPLDSVLDEIRARFAYHVTRAEGANNPDKDHKQSKIDAAKKALQAFLDAKVPGREPAPAAKPAAKKGAA